jgi:hypothetical protein
LGAHWEAGRLALPELEERVDGVYTAKTRGQLDALLRDLPSAAAQAAPPSGRRRRVFRVEHPLTVLFVAGQSGGTRVVVFGEAPRSVRQAFAVLH